MARYVVTLTDEEIQNLKSLVQKRRKRLPHQTCANSAQAGPETRKQGVDI